MANTPAQSPLAMLVLITPYTVLYLINQLFLQGILDNVHYVFFELIFVLAFRKVFGLPDLSEKLFPSQVPVPVIQEKVVKAIPLVKTSSTAATTTTSTPGVKKVIKKKAARKTPVVKKEEPYAQEIAAMTQKFTDYMENTSIWEKVFEETNGNMIEVYQFKERPMCYKIIAVLDSTAAVTFDLLCDIGRRTEWDPLCVEAKTIAEVNPWTKVQYVRTKAMWPTASRDTVVLGTVKLMPDGSYCNVTQSIEHPGMPERTREKIVRMETAVAGQIICPEPGHPEKCRLIQVLDADLKGWIPEKVIQMVSTKSVPQGMRNINDLVPKLPKYTDSRVIERLVQGQAAAAAEEASGLSRKSQETQDGEEETEIGDAIEGRSSGEGTMVNSSPSSSSARGNKSMTVSGLSERLKAVEKEDSSSLDKGKKSASASGNNTRGSSLAELSTALQKKQAGGGFLTTIWDGIKYTLGFNKPGRANKVLMTVIIMVIFGVSAARYRRR